ncbi:MarR family winged helix-turn-helix transcriptional regulator [Cellulomonas wangsupingiae]|uniref:MarR family transcriptional regulator n=1 Tax=Cellulomonas wangsupingiae TaxID=2968085 RepID=A0ABY5K4I7_9CELL|nr:MarR family transcriptional regulator [Cellulomonas wangsupingiae]MCC2335736.1 MarR family transcriptional regulator [Cellulomonas wangsupingiae]UUI63970.1 MarR family transcriptional regulator [Cellulomonas wangsupingiae]
MVDDADPPRDHGGADRTAAGRLASAAGGSDVRASVDAWEALFRAQVTLMRRFARDDVWGGSSIHEYDVLYTLSRAPQRALRLRELAESSLLTQPSLSRLVDRLEADGLVRRAPVEGDRRGKAVHLTDAGALRQREIGRRHARSIDALVGGALSPDELTTLERLCTRLRLAQRDLPDPTGPDRQESPDG